MADERAAGKEREALIDEIRGLLDDLEASGVKRERVQFYKLKDDELPALLAGFEEQLERRKKFLGVN